ncbi:MAG: hypothetical protein WC551_13215 [Patescibacteria group bacterium]
MPMDLNDCLDAQCPNFHRHFEQSEFWGAPQTTEVCCCMKGRDPATCDVLHDDDALREMFDAEVLDLPWINFCEKYGADYDLRDEIEDLVNWQEAPAVAGALDRAFEAWKEERNP